MTAILKEDEPFKNPNDFGNIAAEKKKLGENNEADKI